MADNDKPAPGERTGPRTEPDTAPQQGYIPRPPSQADVDLVSSQQGMITDEWGEGPEPRPRPDTRKDAPDPEAEPPAV
ncbi:MAG: hypothetical protein JWP04_1290 [Belnapia sp.]|jgi:hypothetical protein|nr:hypothetical protein [Belnapia sp.]